MPLRGRKPKPKDEMRDKLIELSRDIFTKYGYQQTNINDIAIAAGMGKSTLYYYFSGKEAIFKSVIESELQELRNSIIEEVKKAIEPQSKIKAYILTRISFLSLHKNLYTAIREQSLSSFSYAESIRQMFDVMEVQQLTAILNDGVKDGYFKINEPEFAATGLIAALRGVQLKLLTAPKKAGFEQTLDSLLGILLYGLIK